MSNQNDAQQERGSATPFILILAVGLLIMVGLVVDGGGQVNAKDQANSVAQSAARAAVVNISDATGGTPVIDTASAQAAAQTYIAAAGKTGTVTINGNNVTVTVTSNYQTVFLSLAGINTLTGSATSTAQLAQR
ncbi:Tad domain-containing protein [Arthrobacter sp. Rue61a]|uniref:Tad domain-containing protein n=1 Tax=Arthrobacter sp. Rue61a TaxID=1118963 RepID=UPI000150AE95|nr:Tad domain-containing protein [Arthrobacter sp. Rue61a]AFR34596.1 putative membrane protein [Arthrobacter sp. Rue61a]